MARARALDPRRAAGELGARDEAFGEPKVQAPGDRLHKHRAPLVPPRAGEAVHAGNYSTVELLRDAYISPNHSNDEPSGEWLPQSPTPASDTAAYTPATPTRNTRTDPAPNARHPGTRRSLSDGVGVHGCVVRVRFGRVRQPPVLVALFGIGPAQEPARARGTSSTGQAGRRLASGRRLFGSSIGPLDLAERGVGCGQLWA